ncbi:hypothetical protein VQ02_31950 [Methylobacterium variabile]|uniref:Uncharacterized protein n=1 Tax=Methylobacterium variabile TaxID=298794 RepID=A0A0J6RZE1_9HYPH|nr:hypothetical protein VQ02_31950 [Methylobacterium variabile]
MLAELRDALAEQGVATRYWICGPVLATHLHGALETISGPLPQRMCSGMPCRHIASGVCPCTKSKLQMWFR